MRTKKFKEFLPEEETFDELVPSDETKNILAESQDLQMPEFVKKLIEKKRSWKMLRCLILSRECLKKQVSYQKSKEKGFSFVLDPFNWLFFLKKSFDFLKYFQLSWTSWSFFNSFFLLSKALSFFNSFDNEEENSTDN